MPLKTGIPVLHGGEDVNADELRRLAVLIERTDHEAIDRAADYLRACADAMEKGPVAWHYDGRDQIEVYPLAMPAPLLLPEPMTDEEVAALIAETEYLPTDHAVRYLVETGERRVEEANDAAAAPTPPAQQDDEALAVLRELVEARDALVNGETVEQLYAGSRRWRSAASAARALLEKRGEK